MRWILDVLLRHQRSNRTACSAIHQIKMSLGAISALAPRVWLLHRRHCIQSTSIAIMQHESRLIATLSPCERSASAERALNFTMQFVDHRDKCSHLIRPCAVWSAASDYWRRRKELLTLLLKNRLARQVVWCRKSAAPTFTQSAPRFDRFTRRIYFVHRFALRIYILGIKFYRTAGNNAAPSFLQHFAISQRSLHVGK